MNSEGASGAQGRRLHASSSDGGGSEEDVLWAVSRSHWLKKFDPICLIFNLFLVVMGFFRFYQRSQESVKSKREQDQLEANSKKLKRSSMGSRKSLV